MSAVHAHTQGEIEALAGEIRRMAGAVDDGPVLATRMATRLLGPDAVALDHRMASAAFLRRTRAGGYQIVVNPAVPDVRFAIAHEIGEWALQTIVRFAGHGAAREQAANRIAAALLAPAPAVLRAHDRLGERLPALADAFGVSQTAVVLRLAEVRGDERAVVTRTGHVIVRTRGAYPWAAVPVLEVARGQRAWRGLRKTALRGGIDAGRVALKAI